MDHIRHDLRHAWRSIRRSPGFTLVAILVLALGIGATTAIFTVLDRVVLRPLPYEDADRLVYIDSPVPGVAEGAAWGISEAGYFFLREHNRLFEEIGAYSGAFSGPVEYNLVGDGGGTLVKGGSITPSLLEVLRAYPVLGRLIRDEDDQPGSPTVAMIGYDFWTRAFGRDPGVVGSTLEIEGVIPVEIVGVLPQGFHLPGEKVDLWVPNGLNPSRTPVNRHAYRAIGRLLPGATVAEAQEDLARLTAMFTEAMPSAYSESFMLESGFTTRATPLRVRVIGGLDGVIWILLAAVGLVLLIACANVANLLLVRAEARRRDTAIRAAIGASRSHLARQALSETLLLTILAGAAGIWLAHLGLRLMLATAPAGLPRLDEVAIGGRSVAVALAVSGLIAITFGLLPHIRRPIGFSVLRDGSRGVTGSRRGSTLRAGMVTAQMALSVVLLGAAGLMLRSFERLRHVEPGFAAENVLTAEIAPPAMRYQDPDAILGFYRDLTSRLATLPGVHSSAAGAWVPIKGGGGCSAVFAEDGPLATGEESPCVGTPVVTPGYFASLGIPLSGREADWAAAEYRVGEIVVTRALAERFWPGEDPIGKRLRRGGDASPYYSVVGVTGHLRGSGLDEQLSEAAFFPMLPLSPSEPWQTPRRLTLLVRTEGGQTQRLAGALRTTVSELDPTVSIGRLESMEEVVATSNRVARTSFTMFLLGIGAGMGVLLSSVGLFGVLAFVVAQRTSEIGARVALGAPTGRIIGMILGHSLKLTIAGVIVGLGIAIPANRVLRALLFEISPTDPVTLATVSLLLPIVALVASYLPARRAARVDPMIALRAE